MKIHIITTGGTIEGLDYENPIQKQSNIRSIQDMIGRVIEKSEYSIDKLLDKDSKFITKEDRVIIETKIRDSSLNKILLTHGTVTMIETAQYLGKLSLDKTIVLTGAFILGTNPETDASFNLGYAISALKFLDKGVYIAMNGKIFSWNNVHKNENEKRFENLTD